jgi:hypothetical protein
MKAARDGRGWMLAYGTMKTHADPRYEAARARPLWGQAGKHSLVLSLTAFEPKRFAYRPYRRAMAALHE